MADWTQIKIYTSSPANDILCGRLLDFGIRGFEIHDPNDFEEFLENKDGKWDYIDDDLLKLQNQQSTVTVYVPENSQGMEMLSMIKEMISSLKREDTDNFYGSLDIEINNMKEEDWANNWKQYFKPFNVGEKLFVKPSWEDAKTPDGRKLLQIDPESSFGTGQHHTTKLCLEILESSVKEGDKVLDMGCGSGILSIAASLLGAKSITSVDIEENAVKIAGQNFIKNSIDDDKYTIYCGNILDDKSLEETIGNGYDLILANIVADVLKAMAPLFNKFLKKGGILIVSGIITEREEEVLNTIKENGFEVVIAKEKEGWAAAKLIKK
jgi:ribosomal protein L11 methyltransferase